MDSPQPQPPHSDPSLVISDEEVEQLLNQAETLVEEIAENTVDEQIEAADAAQPADDLVTADPSSPDSDLETAAVDALQAVEATSEIAQELTEILDEAPTAAATSQDHDDVPAEPVEELEAPQAPIANAALDEVVDEADSGQLIDMAPAEPVEEIPIEETPLAQAASVEAEPQSPPVTSPPQPAAPVVKVPIKILLAAAGRGILRALMAIPIAVANLLLRLIVLLDRPFDGLAVETKLRIGLIALITIFMGTAAWILPRITAHNPYLEMGP